MTSTSSSSIVRNFDLEVNKRSQAAILIIVKDEEYEINQANIDINMNSILLTSESSVQ